MWLKGLFAKAPRVEMYSVAVLSGDLESLYVKTKVDGVAGIVSVADLVRSYQKVSHADNYMRAAKKGL
jgi:hypothetical protein